MNDFDPQPNRPFAVPDEPVRQDSFDLRSGLGILARHWKALTFLPVIALATTFGGLKLVTPLYQSTVEILVVDPNEQAAGGISRQLSSFDVDPATINSEIALIQSPVLLEHVAKELGLDKDPEFQAPSLPEVLGQKLGLSRLDWFRGDSADETDEDAVGRAAGVIEKHLSVERVDFSYIVAISISAGSPRKAQRIADAIANDYLADQAQARAAQMQRAREWLGGQLDQLRARVLQSEQAIQELRAQSGLSDVGPAGNLSQQQTSDFNGQLMAARADVAQKRASYQQAQNVIASHGDIREIPEVMASSMISQLSIQLSDLNRKEAELRNQFGDKYPEVLSTRAQEASVDKTINGEVTRILGNMRNTYDAAARQEQALEATLKQHIQSGASSDALAKLQDLQAMGQADRTAYQTMLGQYDAISQRATLPETGARIVVPASLSAAPIASRSIIVYALAGMLSIGAALGFAILLEVLDPSLKTSAQVERAFGYRVIGMIPLMSAKGIRRRIDCRKIVGDMVNAPLSRLSEAVQMTRVALGLAYSNGASEVFLVTSALPGEGKTTTALLLAASSARAGKKTLLIDCDLRRKSMSKSLSGDGQGLNEVLSGDAEVTAVVRTDEATGIQFVPAGSGQGNPTDLLTSQRMKRLLSTLRSQYECIVLDTSPLLVTTEAVALGALADKILMVVEWKRTPRAVVAEALNVLSSRAQRIGGIVLTKVDFKLLRKYAYDAGSGYYGRYGKAIEDYYIGT
jgi:capsular exopolysaccharide synthesis family protein